MPLGATSRKSPVNRLGATPYARANARENASVEPYPASKPASVTEPARPTRHAARSSSSRRRNAAGASPKPALTSRSKWNRLRNARPASRCPSNSSSSAESTVSTNSRSRSGGTAVMPLFDQSTPRQRLTAFAVSDHRVDAGAGGPRLWPRQRREFDKPARKRLPGSLDGTAANHLG